VSSGCIKPLCDLLTCGDNRIVTVALEGLENILRIGEEDKRAGIMDQNPFVQEIDQVGGLDLIEQLQNHPNNDIYDKCVKLLETYIGLEEEEDQNLAPSMDEGANQYTFGAPAAAGAPVMGSMPAGGFNFGLPPGAPPS